MKVKSRHRSRIDEGSLEAAGAVLSVQKEMMGYVIHNSRGRGKGEPGLVSAAGGVLTKMM